MPSNGKIRARLRLGLGEGKGLGGSLGVFLSSSPFCNGGLHWDMSLPTTCRTRQNLSNSVRCVWWIERLIIIIWRTVGEVRRGGTERRKLGK